MSATIRHRAGLYGESVQGSALYSSDPDDEADFAALRAALRQDLERGPVLAAALGAAIARARAAGLDAFAPDSATLGLPDGFSTGDLSAWFAQVIGRPYRASDAAANPALPDHGPLSLADWSKALDAVEERVARDTSRLAPGEGGGVQQARGAWFINGERYTLAEVYVAVRMGNVSQTEKFLVGEMNSMNANADFARKLLGVLNEMTRRRAEKASSTLDTTYVPGQTVAPSPTEIANRLSFDPEDDYKVFVDAAGLDTDDLGDLGQKLRAGKTSYLAEADQLVLAGAGTISGSDYIALLEEIRALFDSLNYDNQVKQIRVQSVQSTRQNQLEGLSSFLKGFAEQNQTVGRNLK